jgi:SSS family solute:Na+ symporter
VLGYIAPPIVATFVVGLFYKRANANGAFYSLLIGYGIAIIFIIMRVYDIAPSLTNIHFLIQVPILAVICAVLNIVISQLSAPPSEETVASLTYNKRIFAEETEELKGLPWYQNYRVLSLLLLLLTAIIVIWFW